VGARPKGDNILVMLQVDQHQLLWIALTVEPEARMHRLELLLEGAPGILRAIHQLLREGAPPPRRLVAAEARQPRDHL